MEGIKTQLRARHKARKDRNSQPENILGLIHAREDKSNVFKSKENEVKDTQMARSM